MEVSEQIVDLGAEAGGLPDAPRPVGMHLSDVIGFIEGRNRGAGRPDAQAFTRFEMGFIWETIVTQFFKARMMERMYLVEQVGQISDGIHMTPDAFDLRGWILHEFKATWKKYRGADSLDENHWGWLVQIKAYCRVLNTLNASLMVFYVNGDYRQSGPMIVRFTLKFTKEELDETWAMITNNAAAMKRLGKDRK